MRVLVQTLGEDDARKDVFKMNQKKCECLEPFRAINGYDKEETKRALVEAGIPLLALGNRTYGELACWLTKLLMLERQIADGDAYMLMLEDDVLIEDGFMGLIEALIRDGTVFKRYNIVRLGPWGEGYVTSLDGARRCVRLLRAAGIRNAIDNQLRELCGPEIWFRIPYPMFWNLTCPPGAGAILKTEKIEKDLNATLAKEYPGYGQFTCHLGGNGTPIKDVRIGDGRKEQKPWDADFGEPEDRLAFLRGPSFSNDALRLRTCIDVRPGEGIVLGTYDHDRVYHESGSRTDEIVPHYRC